MRKRNLPFAERVHRRMRERGLGLRELCRAAGLDPSFFSKVLAGKRNPPSDEAPLRRMAEVLQVEAAGLIVAAGRIPAEWHGLWDDGALFQEVHRLASGRGTFSAASEPALPAPGAEEARGGAENRAAGPGGASPWRGRRRREAFEPARVSSSSGGPRRDLGEELL